MSNTFEESVEDLIAHGENVDWNQLSITSRVSEDFLRKYADYLNWDLVSMRANLSKKFMREYRYSLNLKLLPIYCPNYSRRLFVTSC